MGIVRPRDLDPYHIPRVYLSRLCKEGLVKRIGTGMYSLVTAEVTEAHDYAEVAKRIPVGVLCLLSALQYYQLTTQLPSQIWIAIDPKARHPKQLNLPLKVVRFSGAALTSGIEQRLIEKVAVKIFSPAKTIADCFKFRNKIGLDVALEALRAAYRRKLCTMDELWHYAKICRVANVMRPYLESLV